MSDLLPLSEVVIKLKEISKDIQFCGADHDEFEEKVLNELNLTEEEKFSFKH